MSANVETMAYVNETGDSRNVPWHGLGTSVDHAMTSEEALELSGLNWTVRSTPVYTDSGILLPGYKANMRESDNQFLGMVGDRYQIVQNKEAFDFTDALIGEGCTYETAGSLDGGKRVFLLARMPRQKVLGDDVDPYICFTNGFNGYYTIKACCTPIRVVCNNTLNLALNNAKRTWSTKHVGNLQSKLEEARETLKLAKEYMNNLEITADILANTKVEEEEVRQVLDKIYPTNPEDSDRKKANIEEIKDNFMVCMIAPDILKYKGTAWQMVQAASDFSTHVAPKRATSNYSEKNFAKVLDGNVVLDTVFFEMLKKAKVKVNE